MKSDYEELKNRPKDGMTSWDVLAYTGGYFMFDLMVGIVGNYAIYYLVIVVQFPKFWAGLLLFIAGFLDIIFTMVFGLLMDKIPTRWGYRKPWYVFGAGLTLLGQVMMWSRCYICDWFDNQDYKYWWYVFWVTWANIFWPAVQVSFMAFIPLLSYDQNRRNKLIGGVGAFSFSGHSIMIICAYMVFKNIEDTEQQFNTLIFVLICIGTAPLFFFILKLDEPKLAALAIKYKKENKEIYIQSSRELSEQSQLIIPSNPNQTDKQPIRKFLKEKQFYLTCCIYMFARINWMTITVIPFYLIYVLHLGGISTEAQANEHTPYQIALVSMILNFSALIPAALFQLSAKMYHKKLIYILGTFINYMFAIPILFLSSTHSHFIYILISFFGIGLGIQIMTGMGIITDFIGKDNGQGATIFAVINSIEKVIGGLLLVLITVSDGFIQQDPSYFQTVTALIPIIFTGLGGICACFLSLEHYGARIKSKKGQKKL